MIVLLKVRSNINPMGKKIIYPIIAVAAVLFSIIYSLISGAATTGSEGQAQKAPEMAPPTKDAPAVSVPSKTQAAPQATRTTKSS